MVLASLLAMIYGGGNLAIAADSPPTYDEHVLPIFREKCCGCHNSGKRAGGLDLTSYQQMQAGGNSGEVLAAGDPDGSYLWQVASHESEPVMPPNADRIPEDMLAVLRKWITGGLLERDGAKPVVAKASVNMALDPGAIVKPSGPLVNPPRLPLAVAGQGLQPTAVTGLAASPHGDVLAIGGRQQVLLVSPKTQSLIGVLPFPEGNCRTARFSRSAKLLLAGGGKAARSGRVVIWDVAAGKRLTELGNEFDEVLAADLSADQRLVALGNSAKVVRLLTTANGQVESEITKHTDWITSLAFSPDSVLLATGDRAGNLFLWESFGAREWAVLKGHSGGINAISWRPDGLLLATASEDGTIHLWDADQGKKVRSWPAHAGGVADLFWLNDGRLVSTGRDRRVKLWKADGKLDTDLGAMSDIGTRVAVNDSQNLVIAADWAGQVQVFDLKEKKQQGIIDSNPPTLESRLAAADEAVVTARNQLVAEEAKGKKVLADLAKQTAAAEKQHVERKKQLDEATKGLAERQSQLVEAKRHHADAKTRLDQVIKVAAAIDAKPKETAKEDDQQGQDDLQAQREQHNKVAKEATASLHQADLFCGQAAKMLERATVAREQAAAAEQEAATALAKVRSAQQEMSKAVKQAQQEAAERLANEEQEQLRWRDEITFATQAAE
jgi:WD40 repeat protein